MKKITSFLIGIGLLTAAFAYQGEQVPMGAGCSKETALPNEESQFAEVVNGVVQRVIVADTAFICAGHVGNPDNWIRTSPQGSLRKNHASAGYTYDQSLDAFIAPKPAPDATLSTQTAQWTIPAKIQTLEEAVFFSASTTEI